MNSILERTYQSLCLMKNSLIVQARVDESFTHFVLIYACHIFASIPVKTLRKNERLTTLFELFTESKPNIEQFRVLFCPCVVKKYTFFTKNTRRNFVSQDVHKRFAQRGVRGIFAGLDDHTPGYLIFYQALGK